MLEVGPEGVGENWVIRKAGCLLRALQQDHGAGIQSLGLAELPCVVFGRQGLWPVSTGSWPAGWKPSIVPQAFLVSLHSVPFVFSSKWWLKLLQTFVGVPLEGSFDFQQILVLRKSENAQHDRKAGEKCPANAGLVNYSCGRRQALCYSPSWLRIGQQESRCSSGCFSAITWRICPRPRKSCFHMAKKPQNPQTKPTHKKAWANPKAKR